MKFVFLLSIVMGFFLSVLSQSSQPLPERSENLFLNRQHVQNALNQAVDENIQDEIVFKKPAKSVKGAVIMSSILPGSGQVYAKSYLKAAAFIAVEAVAWAVNISYNNQGDKKDVEFRGFADNNWSEQRYWSYVYKELNGKEIAGFPDGQYDPYLELDGSDRPVINDDYWRQARTDLEPFAASQYISGFSHHLPETKTQQYYEMIGKYPKQFGNAWDDASFNAIYQDFGLGNITPMNDLYATMRDDANQLYDKAGLGSMVALINHLVSAIDAGFTTRAFNRRQMEFTYRNKRFSDQYVNMFGLSVNF